jgi:putative heme transporter
MGNGQTASAAQEAPLKAPRTRRQKIIRAIQVLVSLGIIVGIFVGVLPKFADYTSVWATIRALTWLEITTLIAVTALNIFTYWPQMMAAMPGLTFWQAGVNNQSSTTIANTMPLGGAIATGVSYTMYHSWGFTNGQIVLSALITGIWNTFIKLAMPIIALVALVATGEATTALIVPTVIGVAALGAAVVMLGLILHSKPLARRVGNGIGRGASVIRRLFRKPPVQWGDAAVRFRHQTIELVAKRWAALTVSTVASHTCLYLVLLLSLRHVGVSEQEISWAQVLGVFAFVRLISALPITPGGVGLVELGYIGTLYVAGRNKTNVPLDVFKTQVAAAVLLFRVLTFGAQIPLGVFTYVVWRLKKSWRKPVPHEPDEPEAAEAPGLEPVPSPST